jgi:hypothetical protein
VSWAIAGIETVEAITANEAPVVSCLMSVESTDGFVLIVKAVTYTPSYHCDYIWSYSYFLMTDTAVAWLSSRSGLASPALKPNTNPHFFICARLHITCKDWYITPTT